MYAPPWTPTFPSWLAICRYEPSFEMMLSESKTPPVSDRRATSAANEESLERCASAGGAPRNSSDAAMSQTRLDRALCRIAAVAALFIGAGGLRHHDAKLRKKCRRP